MIMFRNNDGFTLIEMLIVLLIVSILILLFVPSINKRSEGINKQGCDALVKVVQAQVDLYTINNGDVPTSLEELIDDYISEEQLTCHNGKKLQLKDGVVSIGESD